MHERNVYFSRVFEELWTRASRRVVTRVTRDIGSKCYWHVSDRFCVEVIDEAIDRVKKKLQKL